MPTRESPLETARRVSALIDIAARHTVVRPSCLARSVVLWRTLRRSGVASDLRIGVRREPGSAVPSFHAWVELGGVPLNDEADVGHRYPPFDGDLLAPDGLHGVRRTPSGRSAR